MLVHSRAAVEAEVPSLTPLTRSGCVQLLLPQQPRVGEQALVSGLQQAEVLIEARVGVPGQAWDEKPVSRVHLRVHQVEAAYQLSRVWQQLASVVVLVSTRSLQALLDRCEFHHSCIHHHAAQPSP